ncbi:signal peptidase I [Actinoplanes sp. NPDC051861]|uniref:signal peptidase I n=1 Tax=Actinoplanes sp. NPDC051861 TaxID=3155170 RepID=UPI0034320036
MIRTAAHRLLTLAVRGRRDHGGPWGEAILAEFDQTMGMWAALVWTAGGLRVAYREQRASSRTHKKVFALAACVLAAAVAVNQFALTLTYVPSLGMEPTMAVTSRYVTDRVAFRVTGVDRGDIVVLPIPGAPDQSTERRVIGLDGDRIECRDGRVFRDGAPVDEPYLRAGTKTDCDPVTVADGTIYVLGDNRTISADSREWGTFRRDSVQGRIVLLG